MNKIVARMLAGSTVAAAAGAAAVTAFLPVSSAGASPVSVAAPATPAAPAVTAGHTAAAATESAVSAAYATGRTLSVPSPYRTISAAVAAARSGDTINVGPGVYRESVLVTGKYINLRATDPNPLRTTIIGQRGRSAIEMSAVPRLSNGIRARIAGFHLLGTNALNGLGGGLTLINRGDAIVEHNIIERCATSYGGGILVFRYSGPVIQYNTIQYNHATQGGGGIMIGASSGPRVYRNRIVHNVSSGGRIPGGGASGAGMYITGIGDSSNAPRSTPSVAYNEISGNAASFAGGGVFMGQQAFTLLDHNHIAANRASFGGGVHIENHGAAPTLSNNNIEHNEAPTNRAFPGSGIGGGVSIYGASRPSLQHNSITYNGTNTFGGGIVVAESSAATINANVLRANIVRDRSIGGASGGGLFIAQASARLTNNVIWQNTAPNGGGVAATGRGSLALANNVLIYNKAMSTTAGRSFGGGLYVGVGSSIAVSAYNNIFAYNNAYQVAQSSSQAVYSYNMIINWGTGMFFSNPTGALTDARQLNGNRGVRSADHNISTQPTFANGGAGDVHLRPGTAGVNQGRTSGAAGTDFNGVRRPQGSATDIGVYEQR